MRIKKSLKMESTFNIENGIENGDAKVVIKAKAHLRGLLVPLWSLLYQNFILIHIIIN